MKIVEVRKIDPKPSRCIEVSSPDRLFAVGGHDGAGVMTHNSVSQRNIVFSCIMRPDKWRFLGIDLKRVELSPFRKYSGVVLGVATTLSDAVEVLRFSQQEMMRRYTEMEKTGTRDFADLPGDNQSLLIMVDEMGELLSSGGAGGGGKKDDDDGESDSDLKGEATDIISSIARLGRAAGVHLVMATQRPDATILPGETKANLAVRINCGRTLGNASSMILGDDEGLRVKPNPKGRLYLSVNSVGNHGQGFYADEEWIIQWLHDKGLNVDGSPLDGGGGSRLQQAAAAAKAKALSAQDSPDGDNLPGGGGVDEELAGDDGDWGFVDNTATPTGDGGMEGPHLKGSSGDDFHRPEDDWDDDLDAVIAANSADGDDR